MKKSLQMALILSVPLLLTSCGKEAAFKSVINKKLEGDYRCLKSVNFNLLGSPAPHVANKDTLQQNMAIIVQMKQDGQLQSLSSKEKRDATALDALVKVSLLQKTQSTEQALNWFNRPVDGKFYVINSYNLTAAGKATTQGKTVAGNPRRFCYAYPQVDKILNYTTQNSNGQTTAKVKYSYKYVDAASWAKDDTVKAAFPEINETLNASDETDEIVLTKGNKGWDTNL